MDTKSLRLRHYPLANVRLSVWSFPYSVSILDPIEPLSVIHFSIFPLINTFTIGFALFMRAMICVSIRKMLITAAMSLVLIPFTFVYASIRVDKDSETFSLSSYFVQLTTINTVFVLFETKVRSLAHYFVIKFIADHFVLLNCITVIFKLTISLTWWSKTLLDQLVSDFLRHKRRIHGSLLNFKRCLVNQVFDKRVGSLFVPRWRRSCVLWFFYFLILAFLRLSEAHSLGLKRVLGPSFSSSR